MSSFIWKQYPCGRSDCRCPLTPPKRLKGSRFVGCWYRKYTSSTERVKAWSKRNPGKMNAYAVIRSWRVSGQRCSCCSWSDIERIYEAAAEIGHEVDHIKQLALGGSHCCGNLQILSPESHRYKTKKDARDRAEAKKSEKHVTVLETS
jgi:hypothetical protein